MKLFKNKTQFLFVIISLLLFSCEQDINIDLPYSGDKIVLNAILTSDSIIHARITKSAPTTNNVKSYTELQQCKADLYENDVLAETLKETVIGGKRYYISTNKIKSNAKYSIRVSYAGLTSVQGEDVVPLKPSFEPVKYWSYSNSDSKLSIKLKDPAGQKNYYSLQVFASKYDQNWHTYSVYNSLYDISIDNFANDGGLFGELEGDIENVIYFNDDTFDGQEITLSVTVYNSNWGGYDAAAPQLSSLSRSAYLYFDSKRKQDNTEENPFAEAVVVYNNIENGFGIVGGVADSLANIRRTD